MPEITIHAGDTYGSIRSAFQALWPRLRLEVFRADNNFYKGDPYDSLLNDEDRLEDPWRDPSAATVIPITGAMTVAQVHDLIYDKLRFEAGVVMDYDGAIVPFDRSLDQAQAGAEPAR